MKKVYDVVQAKDIEGQEKPKWLNCGVALVEEGKKTRIKLDVLPLPDNKGEVWLTLFPKKPKDNDPL